VNSIQEDTWLTQALEAQRITCGRTVIDKENPLRINPTDRAGIIGIGQFDRLFADRAEIGH